MALSCWRKALGWVWGALRRGSSRLILRKVMVIGVLTMEPFQEAVCG